MKQAASETNTKEGAIPDPSFLMQLSTAYWGSQTLLTANRIGLFKVLAEGPMDEVAIASALDVQIHPMRLLIKACIALGLLEERADGYGNSATAQAFLVPGSPGYLGNAILYSDNLYTTWGKLEQALHDGIPPMPPEQYTGEDAEKTRHFVYGMHDRALGIGRAMIELVDLSGRNRMLDVGGGPGTYSSLFAQKYSELCSRVLDLPGVTAIADEIISSMGVADRVKTLAADYLKIDSFPAGNDVVLMSGMFHRETAEECQALIKRASEALDQGGLLVISDVFADEGGAAPLFATLFGLNMMLTAPNGGVHEDSAVVSWMANAGFVDVKCRPFPPPMPHRIVMGVKG